LIAINGHYFPIADKLGAQVYLFVFNIELSPNSVAMKHDRIYGNQQIPGHRKVPDPLQYKFEIPHRSRMTSAEASSPERTISPSIFGNHLGLIRNNPFATVPLIF
jgi:hypothetical protein